MICRPNICDVLLEKISDWEISDITILLTHEHYDHITGVKWLLEHFRATVICSCGCKRILDNPIVSVQDYCRMRGGSRTFHRRRYLYVG